MSIDATSVDAVLFDWGGTLTPWHTVDMAANWRAVAALIDPLRADELGAALLAAEDDVWLRARDSHRSATLAEVCALVGVAMNDAAHAEFRTRWEPHSFTDPEAPAVLAGLRERGVKVGVLSNTIWTRAHHEEIFARDGVLDLRAVHVPHSTIPPHQVGHTEGAPDATVRCLSELLPIVDGWLATPAGRRRSPSTSC